MTLQTERLRTMEQVRAFVEGSEPVDYQPKDRASAYAFVRRTLAAFGHHRLGRADRGCLRAYIGKASGFSAAQISRLIRRQAETGAVVDLRARNSGRPFEHVYAPADIRLLAEVDAAFSGMSGLATCEILRRARDVHGDARFERLADVSRSHLYNLRVGEFTKSRPRRSNDNALVEGRNAHVVRRHPGHEHIPVRFADDVDRFAREDLSPFLNFHRPCLFATERLDAKGKVRPPCRCRSTAPEPTAGPNRARTALLLQGNRHRRPRIRTRPGGRFLPAQSEDHVATRVADNPCR